MVVRTLKEKKTVKNSIYWVRRLPIILSGGAGGALVTLLGQDERDDEAVQAESLGEN